MKRKQLAGLIGVWAISIIVLGTTRPTYWVEKAMEVLAFEFPSKEAYALAVGVVQWLRGLYFGALAVLSVYLLQQRRSPLKG